MAASVQKQLLATATTLATTALNSLANNSLVACTVFNNTIGSIGDGYVFCRVELVVTFGTNPTANTGVSLWFLRQVDGTNYEDGSSSLTPARAPDAVFPVGVSTSVQRLMWEGLLPAGSLTPLLKNDGTSQAFAASGNTLKILPITPEMVKIISPNRIFMPSPVARQHPLNRGRVAWWLSLPGTMGGRQWFDLMGLNPGTLTNMTSTGGWRGTTRPGGFGSLLFDGTDDYVNTNQATQFNSNNFSVACWCFATAAPVSSYQLVTRDNSTGNARQWGLYINSTPRIGASVFKAGDSETAITGSSNLSMGVWHRLMMTYTYVSDGASIFTVYTDGLQAAQSTSAVGPPQSTTTTAQIGRRPYSGFNGYLAGSMDDVSIWFRALSAAEAMQEYNQGRNGYPDLLNRVRRVVYSGPSSAVIFRRSLTNRAGSRSAA